ncbi:tRNA lysidine(34) synthetase TilS [Anabaena cylindrica FACHB-243]|uniref:tRNA(Ile)-lysidine synthase n=1 Tax=Anabaena cylindrica (strain ATCC 27899 / PCC 7122) TaxID=272123 RepID=K9ZC84_ANACC|nr:MULTISPECIES: tRNA lysidine(34) synthetase TilS [Anabaena]AFZ55995.1 tRNA(Ile)-lysidine synthase [Anabaena cylindrica PCC 7122]MBD2419585.1 tRNA lysidine(34) synthetase TilS [Anabaena cylindrica FACHB-243]MBY5282844.1 tRNA lysidine(34) synthetase TilS [Anabaena sp. CCAP 1446/1C]MBY5306928.1 tRNA lysidine(34) synthetase TilS [Anabaena sp. CCAP 1446/1C]MCM2407982.1 tRNA lysidine(34) synthetase TilS [Anabaena sp. CCAP 1446/1C]
MTWTLLHAQIHRTIRTRRLFERNQRLLVAVSGGQDSLCLIKLLLDLQPKWGWNLGIAHCDHRWREDSQANADHVQNLAQSWNIPFYLETAINPVNSEATARSWRYQALTKIAQNYNYQYIVTGHTASDRAETLLYNLIRGTGADGLQALTWQRPLADNILLMRPLLEITRSQTEEFCQNFNLPIWEDSTNQNLKYARNRIRQELLPYLKENFNPQVESNLAQTAELLQAEVEYLEQAALNLREEAMEGGKNGEMGGNHLNHPLRLNRRVLQKAHLALQRRVMRQVLLEILPNAPNFEHIEKLTALITAPNRSQTDPFPGGAIAMVQDSWIFIKKDKE